MPDPARLTQLETARGLLIAQGGGFLRNVTWRPGVNCELCAGIWGSGYASCIGCPSWMARTDLSDRVGFVTYATAGRQSGQVMYGYKEAPRPSVQNQQLINLMLRYAVIRHWSCLNMGPGGPLTHWATVPSLRGRHDHPLRTIVSAFLSSTLADAQLVITPTAYATRSLEPSNFQPAEALPGAHVLLIEDTWVGGGRLQSAAAALKLGGAQTVTSLALARWLEPGRGATDDFLASVIETEFNPDLCPFAGASC